MPIAVTTKDASSLSEGELAELADLCVDRDPAYDVDYLTAERDKWVLVSLAREGTKLRGYSFCTLERIGGTPSLLVGLALVDRTAKAESTMKAIMADQYRRALLAFPDEDVLLGTRLLSIDGFRVFNPLSEVVPRPDHKPSGEERAWARRLAKRFGNEKGLDDRTFVVQPSGSGPVGGIDFVFPKAKVDPAFGDFFTGVAEGSQHRLVAFGWAMAEDLASGKVAK
jgi:hypothetical protein